MQLELEKWISEYRRWDDEWGWVIPLDDLRALLEGKVLCHAEPVAWLCKSADGLVDATASEFVRDDYARFKREIMPLYKPAGAAAAYS